MYYRILVVVNLTGDQTVQHMFDKYYNDAASCLELSMSFTHKSTPREIINVSETR